jgi:hypothetical protein
MMNDQAIELFKQAGAKAYELCKERGYEVGAIDTIWVSMMAATLSELVAKECAQIAYDEGAQAGRVNKMERFRGATAAGKRIEEYFGVK